MASALHGAHPFQSEEGESATGVLITDKSHGPGGDGGTFKHHLSTYRII